MRVYRFLLVVVVSNLLAGVLLHLAIGQSSTWTQIAFLVAAFVAMTGSTAWGIFRFRRAFSILNIQTDLTAGGILQPTGIVELDAIAKKFSHSWSQLRQAAEFDKNIEIELNDIKSLLEEVDRRGLSADPEIETVSAKERLRSILSGYGTSFESNIQQVISCGREIGRATQQVVTSAEEQADAVNQTTGFVDALSSKVLLIGENAEIAVGSSSTAQEVAIEGLQEFHDLIEEMKTIRNHVAARERKLQALGQHSKEIGSIVKTIGTLSSRTDLLALNASIESVRAGEHGRGFAIVAEEVRALAEQSAQAVLDITSRIELIQLETQESISVASGEHDQMHQVINRVTGTLDALKNITDAANDCTSSVAKISDANQQQVRLLQDIVTALEKSSEVSKANRIQAEGVNWTAKSLEQVGRQLEDSLELFRKTGGKTHTTSTSIPPSATGDLESVESNNRQFALEG